MNAGLAALKLVGLVGNRYALVVDAVQSGADVAGSLLVWGGLTVAARAAACRSAAPVAAVAPMTAPPLASAVGAALMSASSVIVASSSQLLGPPQV